MMQYNGRELDGWDAETKGFLKRVLRTAYESKRFEGGRGQNRVGGIVHFCNGVVYHNAWEGNFLSFHGREDVCLCVSDRGTVSHQTVFRHMFQGQLLAETKKTDNGLVIEI